MTSVSSQDASPPFSDHEIRPYLQQERCWFEDFTSFQDHGGTFDEQHPNLLSDLARMIVREFWGLDYSVLRNYILRSFQHAVTQKRIVYSDEPALEYACFNTGLYDDNFEYVYLYFGSTVRHHMHHQHVVESIRVYRFHSLQSHRSLLHEIRMFQDLPKPPSYTEDPKTLVFDVRVEILVGVSEILQCGTQLDRIIRIFPRFGTLPPTARVALLTGAVTTGIKRATACYRTLIPMWHHTYGLQLLMPVILSDTICCCIPLSKQPRITDQIPRSEQPDDWIYIGRTILPLDEAYKDARLIGRIESDWLRAPDNCD